MKKQLQKITLFSALFLSVGMSALGQVPNYVPTNGLVGWWPFNGDANDESGNANNGTVNGAILTTDRNGVSNSAYYFSSSGCATRIDVNVNTSSIQTGLTMSVWVMNVGNGCLGPRLLEFWPGSNGPGMAQWGTAYGSLNIYGIGSTTSTGFSCSAGIPMSPNNIWSHLVYTNDGSQGKFYKDGVLITTVNSTGNPILASSAAFGRMNHPANDAYNGNLDDIGIWNRALSDCEVAALYSGQLTNPPTVDLGNDTLTVCGASTTLDATNTAAGNYLWNTGATSPTLDVTNSGTYFVTVTDTSGCSATDSIYVSVIDPTITAQESAFCLGDSTQLEINPSYSGNAGCAPFQSPVLNSWTEIAPTADYYNLIKEGSTYYLRSVSDVFTSSNINGPWTSLNFNSQIGNTCSGLMLGFDWSNQLYVSTCHNDLYALSGTTWVPKGLGGFGCGGNFIQKLNNNRILVVKAGFLRDLYVSDNNGNNWSNVTNVDNDYWDIVVAENGNIFSCGGSNTPSLTGIIKSTNNGQNWTQINSQLAASVTFVYALEKDCIGNLYAIGNDKIYKSQNNGDTWAYLNNVPALGASYFEIATNGDFYVFINNNGFYKSSDNGSSWQLISDFPIALNGIVRYLKQIDDKIVVFTTQGVFSRSIELQTNPVWWADGTTNQTSIQVHPTQTTTYSVTVSDGVGTCTDSITIQVNNPQINAGSDLSVCEGDSVTFSATGAATYAWDNGVVNGQPFTPNIDGYYTVVGTDTLGCTNTVSVFLDLLQPTSSTISPTSCDTYTAPDNEVYTNSGQYSVIIPNTAGCDSTITINLTVNNSNSGTDIKTVCDFYTWIDGNTYTTSTNSPTFTLQNANGCDSVITLNLTINKLQGLNAGNDITACQGDNITLTASGATTYSWTGGAANGVAFVPSTGTTIYTVTGTDDNGCTAIDAVSALVEYCLDIPGGISPNGDNANDTWTITGLNQYPDAKVLVFDRWGQKVFSGDATNPTWNGTYEAKELPTADYYYIIELGNGEKFNGVVTLKK
jgi:gliding motility-associated-like protein